MAESPELKTLNSIKAVLADKNANEKALKEAFESSQRAFPAQEFKNLTTKMGDDIKDTRKALKARMAEGDSGDGVAAGLAKFLGVDFKSEFFDRLKMIGTGFGEIKKGFKDLGTALGLNKVAKSVGGFWDFLKKILAVGLATVGFISFLEGWSAADKIFGENATFGERLSSGLASVIQSFTGLTDGETADLAKDINVIVTDIIEFLSTEFEAIKNSLKAMWPNVKNAFEGIKRVLEGDIVGGLGQLTSGLGGVGTELFNSESMLLNVVGILAGVKLAGAALSFVSAIGPIFTAMSTIASGLGTVFAAVGGKAALTALLTTLAPTLSAILVPLGIAIAAVVALKSIFDGFSAGMDEFEKSGDISQALSAGLGGFVKSLLNMLTLGLLSDETLDKVEQSVSKFLDPIFEGIADVFKNIWSWIKSSWDDAVFAVKDFLGMELTSEERYKKAEKDLEEKRAKVAFQREQGRGKRFMARQEAELAEVQAEFDGMGAAKALDNKLLASGTGTYKDYIKSIQDSTELTDKQKEIEIDEAKAAREKMTFSSFQNNQTIQNNAIIAKIRPQQEKVVM
tara:strand:+ start:1260 stop:2963 length:1704 start_codon:yes stop_codon:yes gene_type:complete